MPLGLHRGSTVVESVSEAPALSFEAKVRVTESCKRIETDEAMASFFPRALMDLSKAGKLKVADGT